MAGRCGRTHTDRIVAVPPPPIVAFTRLPPGWHSFESAGDAYATSWAYRPSRRGWAPAMPSGGVVVHVFFPTLEHRHPPLTLVLPRKPATLLEGTRDTPEYRIHGRVLGRGVEVWVDIRRRHPTRAELRSARRVVAAIRFSRPSS